MRDNDLHRFRRYYSKSAFFDMLRKISGPLSEYAKLSHLVLTDPKTPTVAKLLIVGALGYLVWPFDLIPDAVPWFGYTDDLAVLSATISLVDQYITDEMRIKAAQWREDLNQQKEKEN
jgi:uncharacterized membrane protein YkvA (DUF1232 family)